MLFTMLLALAAVPEVEDAEPWKDEQVCGWHKGMAAIEMVPARTRRLWKRSSYRVEGQVTIGGKTLPYDTYYPESVNRRWSIDNATIMFNGKAYEKYGYPRILSATDTVPVGDKDGVAISAEPSAGKSPEVVYVIHKGIECEFQPYQIKR